MNSIVYITIGILMLSIVHARRFNNPVIDNADYPDPGAIKVEDSYYAVTTTNNGQPEKFPIHKSTDLENWTLIGYVFNASNFPTWSNKDQPFWAPEIHKIGERFHVYFTTNDIYATKVLCIGVAWSDSPAGPYTPLERCLYNDPDGRDLDSTIINDQGNLYLAFKAQTYWINGKRLNNDGLTFASNETFNLIKPEYAWEDNLVEAPFYVRRNQYHYLFYSGHSMCSDLYAVGIARSFNPMGPYEKRGDPILVQTDPFRGPGHNSIVKDLDNVSDVIVYHTFHKNQVCGSWPRVMMVSSVGWGDDDWPYIYDNE